MKQTVYIVSAETHYEGSDIVGIFHTIEEARALLKKVAKLLGQKFPMVATHINTGYGIPFDKRWTASEKMGFYFGDILSIEEYEIGKLYNTKG